MTNVRLASCVVLGDVAKSAKLQSKTLGGLELTPKNGLQCNSLSGLELKPKNRQVTRLQNYCFGNTEEPVLETIYNKKLPLLF